MIRSSIFYSITFIFFLAALSIFLAALWLVQYDKQNYTKELNTKYSIVARANLFFLNKMISKDELDIQVENYQLTEILDSNLTKTILENSEIIQEIEGEIGSSAILFYKNNNFLKVAHKDTILLFEDKDYQPYRYYIIKFIFSGIFIILLVTYIYTIRKIKPLRKLKRQIDKFAKGNLDDILNASTGNDEISQVSEAFYNAVTQIKTLNNSRQLFLRNIMHELKTPITKGRITAEMINNEKYQQRLITVFERLETLINEFASIEKITSGIGITNVKAYRLVDLFDEAIDLTMTNKEIIKISLMEDISLNVDFKLFSIALKNMIDNAIKYSQNNKMKIVADSKSIQFINYGLPLEFDLSYYLEPFTQGANNTKSLGLGLYIVHNILNAHEIKLNYKYKNGYNIFSFVQIDKIIYNNGVC